MSMCTRWPYALQCMFGDIHSVMFGKQVECIPGESDLMMQRQVIVGACAYIGLGLDQHTHY